MELKLLPKNISVIVVYLLLIVPYGIETFDLSTIRRRTQLLIVPYGIETSECEQ